MKTKFLLFLIFTQKHINTSLIDRKIRSTYFVNENTPLIICVQLTPINEHKNIFITILSYEVLTKIESPFEDYNEFLSMPYELLKDLSVLQSKHPVIEQFKSKETVNWTITMRSSYILLFTFFYNNKSDPMDSVDIIKANNDIIYSKNAQQNFLYHLFDKYLTLTYVPYLDPIFLSSTDEKKNEVQLNFKRRRFEEYCSIAFMKFVELEITQDDQNTKMEFVDLSAFFNNKNEKTLETLEKEFSVSKLYKRFRVTFRLDAENDHFRLSIQEFDVFELPVSLLERLDQKSFIIIVIVVCTFVVATIAAFVIMNLKTKKKTKRFAKK